MLKVAILLFFNGQHAFKACQAWVLTISYFPNLVINCALNLNDQAIPPTIDSTHGK